MAARGKHSTLGPSAAGELLGISPQLVSYRARVGKIPLARQRRPMRFALTDLLSYKVTMAALPVERRGRPRGTTKLQTIMREMLAL